MCLPWLFHSPQRVRCLDLSSNRFIVSRHVIFDEKAFPFAACHGPSAPADLQFLDDDITDPVLPPIGSMHKSLSAGTPPTSAPAGPPVPVPGAPPSASGTAHTAAGDAGAPPVPALYIPPVLPAPGAPTAPRAAPGLPLPRHARPRHFRAHLQRPRRPTSRPPCVRALVPHPGSRLYARSGSSSITTPVDLSYSRLQLLLPQLHLHRPPHFPRVPLLCLLWQTSTP
jgi:hypothetical protein